MGKASNCPSSKRTKVMKIQLHSKVNQTRHRVIVRKASTTFLPDLASATLALYGVKARAGGEVCVCGSSHMPSSKRQWTCALTGQPGIGGESQTGHQKPTLSPVPLLIPRELRGLVYPKVRSDNHLRDCLQSLESLDPTLHLLNQTL